MRLSHGRQIVNARLIRRIPGHDSTMDDDDAGCQLLDTVHPYRFIIPTMSSHTPQILCEHASDQAKRLSKGRLHEEEKIIVLPTSKIAGMLCQAKTWEWATPLADCPQVIHGGPF